MNYREAYIDYTENGKIVYDRVPPEVIEDLMHNKHTLLLYLGQIDRCRRKLGESPVVARILYELADYDRLVNKDDYIMPDFSEYENGEQAETLFEFMIDAARTSFQTYITNTMQSQYNGSGNSKKNRWAWQREQGGQAEDD